MIHETRPSPDVVELVMAAAAARPADTALLDAAGRSVSYAQLAEEVRAVRAGLISHGLRPGDGVLFSVRPSPDAVVLALATVGAGGVVVFADPGCGSALFAARIELARPAWLAAESLLYCASAWAPARAVARHRGVLLPDLTGLAVRHVYAGRRLPGVPRGALALRRLAAAAGSTAEPSISELSITAATDPDAPAAVIFTSGTTAQPRAVVHTRRSLAAAMTAFGAVCEFSPGDVLHTDQLMIGLPALAAGACWSIPAPGQHPKRMAADLRRRHATHTFLFPASWTSAITQAGSSLRCLLLGAAPVLPPLLRGIRAASHPDLRVLAVYGMTELPPVAVATAEEKLGYAAAGGVGDLVGRPVPGVTARVDGDGQLLVAGPHLCHGYLGESRQFEHATGDLARIDPDGRIVLHGRTTDMIIRGDLNLYPGLYEPAIADLPGVAEAALVGVSNATGDERVVLAVVPEHPADAAGLHRRLRTALPTVLGPRAMPDRIEVLPELPRSGRAHKLDRARLRELVRG